MIDNVKFDHFWMGSKYPYIRVVYLDFIFQFQFIFFYISLPILSDVNFVLPDCLFAKWLVLVIFISIFERIPLPFSH